MKLKQQRGLMREDLNHILRVGAFLLFGHGALLAVHYMGYASTLTVALLWAFLIRTCWRSVEREADLMFKAQDTFQNRQLEREELKKAARASLVNEVDESDHAKKD